MKPFVFFQWPIPGLADIAEVPENHDHPLGDAGSASLRVRMRAPDFTWIVDRLGSKQSADPFNENRQLFREFCQLRASMEEFVRFASQNGFLRKPKHVSIFDADAPVPGESINFWASEVASLKEAYEIACHLKHDDDKVLERYFASGRQRVRISAHRPPTNEITSPLERKVHTIDFLPFDGPISIDGVSGQNEDGIKVKATNFRQRAALMLNRRICERLRSGVSLELVVDQSMTTLRTCLRPHDLLSAMWLQLSMWLQGITSVVSCQYCGWVFEPSRSDQMFCCGTCKVAANRRSNVEYKQAGKKAVKKTGKDTKKKQSKGPAA